MDSTVDSGTHFHELDPKAVLLTMAGILIAIFMGSLDQTIVATALPTISKSLHGLGSYSGVVTAYLITSTVALPLAGKFSDVYGRKRLLIGGMVWFVLSSVLCGLAQSMGQLIAFRALQGIGAGVMQAAANTTIADIYPPIRRGRAIGFVSMTSVLASIIGPVLGGYLTDGPGWQYTFYLNIPVCVIGCLVVARYFPRIARAEVKNFTVDYAGAATLIATVVPILLALHEVGVGAPWISARVAGLLVVGIVCLIAFLTIERRASHPIVPIQVFGSSIISISLIATGLSMAAAFGLTLFVPLFVQSVLHTTAQASGEILLPLIFTGAIGATASGHLVSHFNRYRSLALFGVVLAVIGGTLLTRMTPATSVGTLIGYSVVTSLGLSICMPIYNIAVQNAARLEVLGVTTSMVYFTRLMASSIGVAVYGTILASRTKTAGMAPALSSVFGLMTGLTAAVLLATLFLREIPLRKSNAITPQKT